MARLAALFGSIDTLWYHTNQTQLYKSIQIDRKSNYRFGADEAAPDNQLNKKIVNRINKQTMKCYYESESIDGVLPREGGNNSAISSNDRRLLRFKNTHTHTQLLIETQ